MSADVSSGNQEEFGKDLGLIQEAVITGRRVGAGREFWSKITHDRELFEKIHLAVMGRAVITDFEIQDTGRPIFVPNNSTVARHKTRGVCVWNEGKFYLSKESGENALSANFHTLFGDRRYLIPRGWIGKGIIFAGTMFRCTINPKEFFWIGASVHENGLGGWYPVYTDIQIGAESNTLFACMS